MTAELPSMNRPVQEILSIPTWGRGMYELTDAIDRIVGAAQIKTGVCHIFMHHNSASLVVCERSAAEIRADLEKMMERLVPDGSAAPHADPPQDTVAHLRAALTQTHLTVPITDGRFALGRWQGIYIWEHQRHAQHRSITVTVQGQ